MKIVAPLTAPGSLNHIAYPTWDSPRTYDFYTRVLKCQFLGAIQLDIVPSSGEETPYLHTFYGLTSGEAIAFFEVEGMPRPSGDGIPLWIRHIALNVSSMDELRGWREHLLAQQVEVVGIVDHDGMWESLYIFDPNGVRVELTYQVRAFSDDDQVEGHRTLEAWSAGHPAGV